MTTIGEVLYLVTVLFLWTLFYGVYLVTDFIRSLLEHWEVIGLIITNILALFTKPPLRK